VLACAYFLGVCSIALCCLVEYCFFTCGCVASMLFSNIDYCNCSLLLLFQSFDTFDGVAVQRFFGILVQPCMSIK